MSFKISVPRTNYIKNTRVEIDPTGVNKGSYQDWNRNMSDREAASTFGSVSRGSAVGDRIAAASFRSVTLGTSLQPASFGPGSAVGDREAAASFGGDCRSAASFGGDRFRGGLSEAPPSEASKGVYKEVQYETSYTKVEDNCFLKPLCPVIESDKYGINKNCLKYEQESVDYDISKLLKDDNQHVTNSFDLIKDIDDCGKINEIFNKMFCNIDNNTNRDQLSESLKNKKKVEPFFINKFNESGFSFFNQPKESTNPVDLSEVDPFRTGFFDFNQLFRSGQQSSIPSGGPSIDPLRSSGPQSSRPSGGESEDNTKKINCFAAGPIGDGLFELTHDSDSRGSAAAKWPPSLEEAPQKDESASFGPGSAVGDREAASTFGSDREAAASYGGDLEKVDNKKGLEKESVNIGMEGVNIKKKNPRRKKNKKNKRMCY